MVTAINNLDGFTLEDNPITSQQALILAEAIANDHESMTPRASCSNKLGSITQLV